MHGSLLVGLKFSKIDKYLSKQCCVRIMSGESRDQALQHLRKAESELGRGGYSDALQTLEKAGRLANESEAPDVIFLVIGAIAYAMQSAGGMMKHSKATRLSLRFRKNWQSTNPSLTPGLPRP